LYEENLFVIAKKLGKLHKTTTDVRYWEIIIGPWLRIFMDVLFDRYESIRLVEKKNIETIEILKYDLNQLIASDFSNFYEQIVNDEWNYIIFAECIKEAGLPYIETNKELKQPVRSVFGLRRKILDKLFLLSNKFTHSYFNKIVFISPYIQWNKLFKWQLSLSQIPWAYREQIINLPTSVDFNKRKLLKGDKGIDGYEFLLRRLIFDLMPLNYIENFDDFRKKSLNFYPKNPKLIYTASAYQSDDSFKFWVAHQTKNQIPFVIGQHGGNFGTGKVNQTEDHQISISDAFVSWGWNDNRENIKPLPTPQLDEKAPLHQNDGDIILTLADYPRYFYCQYSIPYASQVLEYIEGNIDFIKRLENSLKDNLKLRLAGDGFNWSIEDRIRDEGFGSMIHKSTPGGPNKRKDSFLSLLNNCRLSISTSNTATFLETLSLNFPTIVFFDPNLYEFRDDAIPFFAKLRRVGILHDTPDSAAQLLNEIGGDIYVWWNNKELQKARKEFCDNYALQSDDWHDQWKGLFQSLQSRK